MLLKANLAEAESVMIFASDEVQQSSLADGQTLLIATTIEDYSKKTNKPIYTIAEINDEIHIPSFIHGGIDEFVTPTHTSARLIAKSGSYKGVSEVFRQLASSNYGSDIFTIQPHRNWRTYKDAFTDLYEKGATLISIDNELNVTEKTEEILRKESKLLIVCKEETYEKIKSYIAQ
nr:hypothetical protein [Oceanobacillus halophilus]